MIDLASPFEPLHRGFLDSPGGFAWWYADLTTVDGDGVVLIWSFGLPFLPGQSHGPRNGAARPARIRPSINVNVYKGGQRVFYLLQELPEEQATWVPGTETVHIGQSTFTSEREGDRRNLVVHLDCPIPGADHRLQAHMRVSAPHIRYAGPHASEQAPHHWSPLAGPSEGHFEATCGDWSIALRGRAYHDRNGGHRPMHELGIRHWIWGRAPYGSKDRIYYLLWPEDGGRPQAHGFTIHEDGAVTRHVLSPRTRGGWLSRYGRWLPRTLELTEGGRPWLTVRRRHLVDSSSFYVRTLTEHAYDDEPSSHGVAEMVWPHHIDGPLIRHLVPMAVHHTGRRNHPMVGWFNGPTATRMDRLRLLMDNPELAITDRQLTEDADMSEVS